LLTCKYSLFFKKIIFFVKKDVLDIPKISNNFFVKAEIQLFENVYQQEVEKAFYEVKGI